MDAEFNMVICGLDSITARRWINNMLLSLLQYDENGELQMHTMIPMIDGGTEGWWSNWSLSLKSSPRPLYFFLRSVSRPGFKGNARVLYPGVSACVECMLDLFPPQVSISVFTFILILFPVATVNFYRWLTRVTQVNYPMCTLANTPRLPEHCIEYVKV